MENYNQQEKGANRMEANIRKMRTHLECLAYHGLGADEMPLENATTAQVREMTPREYEKYLLDDDTGIRDGFYAFE